MTPLEQINIRRLTAQIRDDIAAMASTYVSGEPTQRITAQTFDYLALMKEKGFISSFAVKDAYVVRRTWATLYPNVLHRAVAYLTHRFLGNSFKQKWYHTILPYVIEITPIVGEPFFEDYVAKDDVDDYLSVIYNAYIVAPYSTVTQDITMTPMTPVEQITFKASISEIGMRHA